MTKRSVRSIIITTAVLLAASSSSEAFAPHQYAAHESGLLNTADVPTGLVSLDQLQQLEAVYQNSGSIRPSVVNTNDKKKISTIKVTSTSTSRPLIRKSLTSLRETVHRPVSQYSRSSSSESASTAGLTRYEEMQYSFQLRTFRAAVRLRDQLVRQSSGMFIHPSEAEWANACGTTVMDLRRVMHEGQEARSALVAANIGLVTSFAKKHYHATKQTMEANGGVGTILTLQDLIQEGNLGLMEAAERYQPEKGFRFSTYATWWIRQRISKSVAQSSRIIRLPAHVHTMLQKVRRAKAEIRSSTGKEPTLQDLSQFLEIPIDRLQQYTKSSQSVVSLESPLRTASFKDDSRTLGDTLASDGPTPYEDAEADHLRRDIRTVMDSALAERERAVIIQRFGLDDNKPRTVAETAAHLGITTDRVRLVEARALNKLRHPRRNYLLKEYIGSGGMSDADKLSNDLDEPSRMWSVGRNSISQGKQLRQFDATSSPKKRSVSFSTTTTCEGAPSAIATTPQIFFDNPQLLEDDEKLFSSSSSTSQQGKVWLF